MIITISGLVGAGKTTIGKELAMNLNYRFMSMGDLRGDIAKRYNMTLDELNKKGERDFSTDKGVDDYQIEIGRKKDNMVIEGRLSFHFIPHSYKVFLTVDSKTGANRVIKSIEKKERGDETKENTLEKQMKKIENRIESDKKRYKKYYNINPYNYEHYDCIVDTSRIPKQNVPKEILKQILIKQMNIYLKEQIIL